MITSSVSAVIPVFNDQAALSRVIPTALDILEKNTPWFELIIAEDASKDGSFELARRWAIHDSRIRVLHRDKRLGRGSALTRAWKESAGDIFCYFDVDQATDMKDLPRLLQAIEEGYDGATGSRLIPKSYVVRDQDREMKSRVYNYLVRIILGSSVHDHQCGFKAFRRETMSLLIPFIHDTHWFWDTELLILCQKKGYVLTEIPVRWIQGPDTTVRTSDILSMSMAIMKLWTRLHLTNLVRQIKSISNTQSQKKLKSWNFHRQ
ncbi:MAG TPA: dolichyl-phosphate beta-glucosyltransferase [Methanospirillum sp.]|uniref:dolichyl-phosphate beta-glucosyltransferase n=1 Tax=Methanospirillum sp. TaxID=45200 RepID=UPI002BA5938A|nr:dolichyl-phosphate beta-glucosyltransferase [Methanospirillum sp.]HWQ65045.1 dolichyl-phosphate beta-glucosyltransferase [Methanospirillum sp.]